SIYPGYVEYLVIGAVHRGKEGWGHSKKHLYLLEDCPREAGCAGQVMRVGSTAADTVHGWILLAKQASRYGLLRYAHGVREVECTSVLHHMLKLIYSHVSSQDKKSRIARHVFWECIVCIQFLSNPTPNPEKVNGKAARGSSEQRA
ncbi:unnamed protein product, partial [Ectocarpus sp. 13 AM-2016]